MKGFTSEWLATRGIAGVHTPMVTTPETQETEIQQDIAKLLDAYGRSCYYIWHRTDRAHTCKVGTPDFVGVIRGVTFAIEVKRPGGKVTTEQAGELMRLKLAGARTLVAYSADDVRVFTQMI